MLKGKVAIVTGSTSGIGLAIARALAKNGADVMLNGFGEAQAIEKTRAGIEAEFGVKVGWSGADMSQPAAVTGLVDYTVRRLGGIDILCNNAGIQHTASVERFPPEKWDAIIAVNLSAAFHATRVAVPHMRKKGWGRIVNTASVHGLVASVEKAAYVAAKHGLVGLTKVVALETAGSGITCNAFCPGWVLTELVRPQIEARAGKVGGDFEAGARDLLAEKQPSKQLVTVDQLAAYILFLCSDAAAQVTGTALPLDGGWTAQ
ncbi:MAG TPA: 3-hydroxybutyrate dehydrogenase [Alphaproteobacteria bacterium]|jgi:3-hydroxybutyrate dehydrogenase